MNNRFKKTLCLVIAMIFTLMIAGCGETTSKKNNEVTETGSEKENKNTETKKPKEKTKITFWTFHSNYEKEFMASLAEEYNKINDEVEVVYENIPQSEYVGTKLTTAFASNSGPDVFIISPGDFLKYVNSNVAMDLTPYYTEEMKNDFLESSLDAVTVNDKIYAVPFEVELLGLYYNKDMLKEASVEVPKTWDNLIDATKKLTTDKVAGMVIEPQKGYYQNFTWYPFLWQGGGKILDAKSKKATFEGEAVENALGLWSDLIDAGAPSKLSKGTWEPFVGEGTTAMQICGTWIISRLEKDYSDMNIGLAPIPVPEGGNAATDAGGWKFMVNGKSDNAEEAAKFIMWAMAENVELPLKWCTETKFAFSPRRSVVEAGKEVYDKGLRKVFKDSIYETAIGEPRYPAEVVNIVGDAIQKVMYSGSNPKDAAKEANKNIQKYLDDYEGSF